MNENGNIERGIPMFLRDKTPLQLNKVLLIVLLILFLSGCQTNSDADLSTYDQKRVITIATGGNTGPYFAIADEMAVLFDNNISEISTSVQSTGGGVENIQLLLEKNAELGLVMADTASLAYEGKLAIRQKNEKELRAIAALYPNYVHIITLKNSEIDSVEDLIGKRVGVGDVGSGTEVNALTILQAFGINYEDIEEYYLSYKESVIELKNGKIDAAFLTSGLPNAMVMELVKTNEVTFIPVAKEKVEEIATEFPYYSGGYIPRNTYLNDTSIPTAVITNILLTREDMAEDLVYDMTKVIFHHIERLHQAHHAAADIRLETAQKGLTLPLHPGAKRFYEEQRGK